MPQTIRNKTIANISYSAIGRIVSFAFQAVTNIVLSRELGASDYGIVGFAMIFINFLRGFGDLGINNAAIQRKEMDERSLGTAFTLKFVLGIVTYFLAFVIAGFAPNFFNNPSIVIVIRLLALNIMINTFVFVPGVILARSLNFKYISICETLVSIVSSIVAITLVLNGFKFWGIVVANIVSNAAFVVFMNYLSPHKPIFCLDKVVCYSYLKYGARIFFAGLLSFAVFNFDNFIVGSVAGDRQLGYYVIAFNWGSMICSIMTGTVMNVLFPTLSNMQGDADKMIRAYKRIIEYVALCSFLFNTVFFIISDDFLVFILGKGTDKWMPALISLKILCVYGVARSLLEVISTYYAAKGLSWVVLRANVFIAVLELTLVYPAILYGSIELVASVVFVSYLAAAAAYLGNLPLLGISGLELFRSIRPAIISSFVLLFLYYTFGNFLQASIGALLIKSIVAPLVYCLVYGGVTNFQIIRNLKFNTSAA